MTLTVALACKDGVVMASDGRLPAAPVADLSDMQCRRSKDWVIISSGQPPGVWV